jgi:hypothetical protein
VSGKLAAECVKFATSDVIVTADASTNLFPSGLKRVYVPEEIDTLAPSRKIVMLVVFDFARSKSSGILIFGAYGVDSIAILFLVSFDGFNHPSFDLVMCDGGVTRPPL